MDNRCRSCGALCGDFVDDYCSNCERLEDQNSQEFENDDSFHWLDIDVC